MRRPASFKTFITLSTSIILSSCGGGNSKLGNTSSFNVSAILAEERPLSVDERNIATRICYAYQSKSKNFRGANFLGSRFIFLAKKTDCGNNVTSYQVTTTMNYDQNNGLSYFPTNTSNQFFGKVETDTSGYLAQLCPSILTNQPVSNTTTQQNFKIQISFIREQLDGFVLNYFVQQPDLTYKISNAEKFKVRTQIDYTNGQVLGMDEYYSSQQLCSSLDRNKFSNYEQSFTSR